MSFNQDIHDIFDIDIWCLKDSYKNNVTLESKNSDVVETNVTKSESKYDLLLSIDNDSDKLINFFISDINVLNLIKKISTAMFYNSKVCIYGYNNLPDLNDIEGINIVDKNFIADYSTILSVDSKKEIFKKLYEYSDIKK